MDLVTNPKPDRKEYFRLWHLKNQERRAAASAEDRRLHPEKFRARAREQRKKHHSKYLESDKKFRAKYRDKHNLQQKEKYWRDVELSRKLHREAMRKVYLQNREKLLARNREYASKNKDKIRAQQRQYRLLNLEKRKQQLKAWQIAHKDDPIQRAKRRIRDIPNQQRRRALKAKATINLAQIQEWMESVKSKSRASCYWCQSLISTKAIHFDHIVALSKGGSHSVENLCVSCAACNLSKHNKPVRIWIKSGQQMLEL